MVLPGSDVTAAARLPLLPEVADGARRVPRLGRARRCRRHGPRVREAVAGSACDHLQLVALRAARLPALLHQGRPQRAAPRPGVRPSRRAAVYSVLSCLHMGDRGV